MATNSTGSTKSVQRSKAKTTAKGQATRTKNQTKKAASTAKTSAKTSATRTSTEAKKATAPAKGTVKATTEYVRQAAGTVVDVPVGVALTAVDRVNDLNDRFSTQHKREVEVRRVRNQVRRELNKVERRGSTARRKALQQAKRTRTRVERDLKQSRKQAETQLRRNRTEAEKRVKDVSERVQALV